MDNSYPQSQKDFMQKANLDICCPKPLAVSHLSDATMEIPLWKRALDLGCILITAPLWLPIMAVAALVIKIVSPGPVVFKQERIGFHGRRFICFKFRTMKVNVATTVHESHLQNLIKSNKPMVKMDNKGDSRLIPLGSFLRATGLDELPQLLNVLKGEMSLVGPRPCTPYEYDCYETWQKRRFEAMPGLTGLWQVSGKNKTTFNEMIHLDVAYAQKISIWMDLKIMLKTFPVLFLQVKEIGNRLIK